MAEPVSIAGLILTTALSAGAGEAGKLIVKEAWGQVKTAVSKISGTVGGLIADVENDPDNKSVQEALAGELAKIPAEQLEPLRAALESISAALLNADPNHGALLIRSGKLTASANANIQARKAEITETTITAKGGDLNIKVG